MQASADEHPDLFWAIRGGGGNFGIVTRFDYRLHPVGPMVQFGLLFWGLEQGREMFHRARDVIADLPRDVNVVLVGLNAPPAPFVPAEHHFRPGYAVMVTGFGDPAEHERVLERLRDGAMPLFEMVSPMPYTEVQKLTDEAAAWGSLVYDKGTQVAELTDDVVDVLTEYWPRKSSPLSVMFLYRLDAAYCEAGDDDTAFGSGRTPRYQLFLLAFAPDTELLAADRTWVRSCWTALQPYAVGPGSYVNDSSEFPEDWVRASYGGKYDRLTRIKAAYDPDNIFRHNANIAPAM